MTEGGGKWRRVEAGWGSFSPRQTMDGEVGPGGKNQCKQPPPTRPPPPLKRITAKIKQRGGARTLSRRAARKMTPQATTPGRWRRHSVVRSESLASRHASRHSSCVQTRVWGEVWICVNVCVCGVWRQGQRRARLSRAPAATSCSTVPVFFVPRGVGIAYVCGGVSLWVGPRRQRRTCDFGSSNLFRLCVEKLGDCLSTGVRL